MSADELCDAAQALIHTRQNISPKRLAAPGPSPAQLEQLLAAAAAAPDHGQLHPWRFVIIPQDKRALLAEVFAQALSERDPDATPEQIASAREKAQRAPLLILAVAQLGPAEPDIPAPERMVSLGCAIQNMLLTAHAMGFGSGLTSGQAMSSAAHAHAVCADRGRTAGMLRQHRHRRQTQAATDPAGPVAIHFDAINRVPCVYAACGA